MHNAYIYVNSKGNFTSIENEWNELSYGNYIPQKFRLILNVNWNQS